MKTTKTIATAGAGAIGAAALVLGAAGVAGAQDEDPTLETPETTETEETVEDNADDEGRRGRRGNRLGPAAVDRLVEEGVITEEQANDLAAVREAIQAEREARRAEKAQGIADVLGITVEDLQAAREEGTTLAELAGDDIDALVDYFVEQKTAKIEEKVASGDITQEQADEKLEGLEDRILNRLENPGEREGRRGNGFRGGFGRGGDAPAQAEAGLST